MKITRKDPIPLPPPPVTFVLELSEAELRRIAWALGEQASSKGPQTENTFRFYCDFLDAVRGI